MTNDPVPPVETLRILSVELPHTSGKISFYGLHQQMVVVGHLTISMYHPVESLTDTIKYFQSGNSVIITKVDIFPPIASGSHMIERASVF